MRIQYQHSYIIQEGPNDKKRKHFYYTPFVRIDSEYRFNGAIILNYCIFQKGIIETCIEEIKRPGRRYK